MKKKLAAGVLSAVLLVGGATAAFGATDSAQLAEIKNLTQQMFGIQKQIIDKEVEAGLRTLEQADTMKKFIDQRQEASDKALANGQVSGPSIGGKFMGMHDSVKKFTNVEPMTEEQIKDWSSAFQARLNAQVEAMKSEGKLTEEQIKTWSEAAQAQLDVQKEALKNGTIVRGDMGGMRMPIGGGHEGRAWRGKIAPESTTTSDTDSTTNIQ